MRLFVLVILLICNGCYLFSGFKKRSFEYNANGTAYTFPLLVPAGYRDAKSVVDSAGNKEQVYFYPGGGFIYFVHSKVPKEYQSINEERHIPVQLFNDGLMYKGMDSSGLYWREVQLADFRFGYRHIHPNLELRFDSAVNYASYKMWR
jgi:hypothetical protein